MPWWPFGSSSNDGVSKLDADLKSFLKEEDTKQAEKVAQAIEKEAKLERTISHLPQEQAEKPKSEYDDLPLLFKDGRYAHLWKTYTPPEHSASISANEKIRQLKDHSANRDAAIDSIATENCVFEIEAERECLSRTNFTDKMTLCRKESRAAERCQTLQAKFLRALGYLSVPGRAPDEEERIQLHADDLYHQMLKHESAVADAKKDGIEPPEFKPILSKENMAKILGVRRDNDGQLEQEIKKSGLDPQRILNMRDKVKKELEEKWKYLTPEERMAAESELRDRVRDKDGLTQDYTNKIMKEIEARNERREKGKLTLADKLQDYWEGRSTKPPTES